MRLFKGFPNLYQSLKSDHFLKSHDWEPFLNFDPVWKFTVKCYSERQFQLRPYIAESTGSRPISKVKLLMVWLVVSLETRCESQMPQFFATLRIYSLNTLFVVQDCFWMILHGVGFWPWGETLYRVGQTFCPLGGNFYGQSYRVTWGCLTLEHFLHERHFWVGTQIWHIGVLDLRARHFTIWNDTEKISMAPCARMTRITWVDTPLRGNFLTCNLLYPLTIDRPIIGISFALCG